jgi:hypothetical protein
MIRPSSFEGFCEISGKTCFKKKFLEILKFDYECSLGMVRSCMVDFEAASKFEKKTHQSTFPYI